MEPTTQAQATETPTPAPSAPVEATTPQLDQAALDKAFAERAARAARQAQADMLQQLGVPDLAAAKAAIEAQRQADEARKTDLERLQGEQAALAERLRVAEEKATAAQAALISHRRDGALSAALQAAGAHDPSVVLTLWQATGALAALAGEDGQPNAEAVQAALQALKTDKPFLFAAPAPDKPDRGTYRGTPTNASNPSQTTDAEQRARAALRRSLGLPT